ncbi:MAG: nucleotidyl transferase AbiEii/AbiGii toxin family protein [Saprospiraceae bacterium]|nr:nucleotidyl transferase AbiEii/AbiGii toxin family protein [Saprospiraceae bacterium]
MLHHEAVEPELLGILNYLMGIAELENLKMVGGTSLALQIGHRKSIDIDLFGSIDFQFFDIQVLSENYEITQLTKSKNINIFTINGIKTDFVNYTYKWIRPGTTIDAIRLSSLEDIAAMKINAITGRGSKKDFIDLFFLLDNFSISEMLGFYIEKYPEASEFMAIRSLSYFEDANKQAMPEMLRQVEWHDIVNRIKQEIKPYL